MRVVRQIQPSHTQPHMASVMADAQPAHFGSINTVVIGVARPMGEQQMTLTRLEAATLIAVLAVALEA